MKRIIPFFMKYKVPFLFAMFCLTLEATVDVLQPTIMTVIVDNGVKHKDLQIILTYGGVMLVVTLFGAIFALGRNYLASVVSQKFIRDLRLAVFKKIQIITFDEIDRLERASLITRMTNDMTQIQNFFFRIMRVFVKAPLRVIGAVIMMIILSPKAALVLIIVMPIAILLIILSIKLSYPFFIKVQQALDRLNSVLREYLSGVRVVKAFNRYTHEEERFNKTNLSLAEATTVTMKLLAIFSPGIALVVNIGIAIILFFSGYQQDYLEVGKIMAFVMYMTQILNSLSMMSNIFNMLIRAKASSERVSEILEAKDVEGLLKSNITSKEKGIEFINVSFSYNTGRPVLRNINLKINFGETIGIVGSTGSGKSTLLNLLLRFYEIETGQLLINGVNIKDYHPKEIRDIIGVVPQNNQLFSGSIQSNLIIGNEKASYEDILRATKASCADEFITTFPEKYETYLGQSGVNLSGGQKQRICIARALIKQPQILLLDDATSAVDGTTEQIIRHYLKDYFSHMTTLIISQKIASVKTCDRIIVLENGEIVGNGRHEQLLNECQVYQDIYQSQIGGDFDAK